MVGCLSSLFGDNYFILYRQTKFLVFVYCFLKLNRDTWANEAVSQTISTNFIFWQVGSLFWCALTIIYGFVHSLFFPDAYFLIYLLAGRQPGC